MHGQGVFKWKDGKKYVGGYVQDAREGYGEFTWPDGRVYKGGWQKGKQHGEGTLSGPKGEFVKGNWRNGKLVEGTGSTITFGASFNEQTPPTEKLSSDKAREEKLNKDRVENEIL